jgi:hypothetical protein
MKHYRLYLSKPLLGFYFSFFAIFILGALLGIVVGLAGKIGPDGPPTWVSALVLAFVLFAAYMWLRFPYEITVSDEASVEFKSIFRKTTTSLSEIVSVHAKRNAIGFVDVVHTRGTVHLLNQMDGFHDFVATIKAANPAVTIKGC